MCNERPLYKYILSTIDSDESWRNTNDMKQFRVRYCHNAERQFCSRERDKDHCKEFWRCYSCFLFTLLSSLLMPIFARRVVRIAIISWSTMENCTQLFPKSAGRTEKTRRRSEKLRLLQVLSHGQDQPGRKRVCSRLKHES